MTITDNNKELREWRFRFVPPVEVNPRVGEAPAPPPYPYIEIRVWAYTFEQGRAQAEMHYRKWLESETR